MKNKYLLMMAALLIGLASCHRNETNSVDLVIVDNGKMCFYDVENQSLTPYEKETDSVLNLLFDDNDHLYYTVSKDQNLTLKMLDLGTPSPSPKTCADWNMTLENAINEITGIVSNIFWDRNKENILIFKTDYEDYVMSVILYDTKTGKVSEMPEEEAFDIYGYNKDFDASHFYEEGRNLYYATPQGNVCLTDNIDFLSAFEDEDELEDLFFDAEAISPDGRQVVYAATIMWGEGWGFYGLANLDGSSQLLLDDSDIWDFTPEWLSDGSVVYVGKAPRPKNDPLYDEDWNYMQPCIKRLDSQKKVTTLSMGETFAVKPFGEKKEVAEKQGNLEGCDVAIFDNGKVTFYNSTTGAFVPYVNETDSVINGVFVYDYEFYYTVAIGDELYLKRIYLSEYSTRPSMCTAWDLKLDECVSETYGKASPLEWIAALDRVGINHNFSWDYYNFADIKFYNYDKNEKYDGWNEDEDVETDIYDEEFMKYEEDLGHFVADGDRYFYSPEDDLEVCLTDKIDFKAYASDPSYYEEPDFCFYSIDPTRKKVAYAAIIEYGDLGHGPLCMSSLDGRMQVAFEGTDASDLTWGWLPDGSLLYVGTEARPTDDPDYDPDWNTTQPCIIKVNPDGSEEVLSHSCDFVVRQD